MSTFKKIILSAKALKWRKDDVDAKEKDMEFKKIREQALARDKNSCQYCGFTCSKYQEIHHLNDDHSDNRLENLITTCPFCHMCFHIGLAGQYGEGRLIFLPEIEQKDLNHLVRIMVFAEYMANDGSVDKAKQASSKAADAISKSIRAKFLEREAAAERLIGTSDPSELANILLGLPDDVYAEREERLLGIRLLPMGKKMSDGEDKMKLHVEAWLRQGPFAGAVPNTWKSLRSNLFTS